MNIEYLVNNYQTKYEEGFTEDEITSLLKNFSLDLGKFNEALSCITGLMIGNDLVTYHSDVITALKCGIERRDIKPFEFD